MVITKSFAFLISNSFHDIMNGVEETGEGDVGLMKRGLVKDFKDPKIYLKADITVDKRSSLLYLFEY